MPTRAPFQPLQGLPLSKTDRAFGVFVTRGWLAARKHRPTVPTLRRLVSLSIATFHLDAVPSGSFMTDPNRAQMVD
jgi:cytochrome oxidase assembly protein ShyY1